MLTHAFVQLFERVVEGVTVPLCIEFLQCVEKDWRFTFASLVLSNKSILLRIYSMICDIQLCSGTGSPNLIVIIESPMLGK